MNERPQVTPGARRQEEDSGTEGSRVYFYFAAVGHCQREPNLARLSPPLRIVTFSTLLLFLLLCSAGALKSRRRPLKRDHSIGSSQQPPPPPTPTPTPLRLSLPPFLQNIPWLRPSCAGARGQASAARGPQRCRLRCGQRLPLHSPISSSHTLLNQSSFAHKCLRFGVNPPPFLTKTRPTLAFSPTFKTDGCPSFLLAHVVFVKMPPTNSLESMYGSGVKHFKAFSI